MDWLTEWLAENWSGIGALVVSALSLFVAIFAYNGSRKALKFEEHVFLKDREVCCITELAQVKRQSPTSVQLFVRLTNRSRFPVFIDRGEFLRPNTMPASTTHIPDEFLWDSVLEDMFCRLESSKLESGQSAPFDIGWSPGVVEKVAAIPANELRIMFYLQSGEVFEIKGEEVRERTVAALRT